MNHDVLNDQRLIAKRDQWFDRLQSVFDRTYNLPYAFVVSGTLAKGKSDPYVEPEKWVDECLVDIALNKAEMILSDDKFVPVCVEFGIYGVHYIDKILGAKVFRKDGQWYNEYLTTPVGELPFPNLEEDETFNLSVRAAKRFVEVGGEFPLFGLPTIASALNIAVNLYGQEILMQMLLSPEKARKDLETINSVLVRIHEKFREILPKKQLQPVISWERTQPPGYGQLCGCTTQLVSKEIYADMLADLDERLLGVYENGGMIHLCGSHTQHVETFKNMKTLKSVQLNDRAAEDLEVYFNELRDDQIIYLNPCDGMPVRKAIEITKGQRLVVCANVNGRVEIQ